MIDLEFIERCNLLFKDEGNQNYEKRRKMISDWNHKNREKLRGMQKKYSLSEKGKISNKRRNAVRNSRVRELIKELNRKDLEAIRIFYQNCPDGYEVDHIIPISKGGAHHISNLQYLTKYENRRKSARIDWKPDYRKVRKLNDTSLIQRFKNLLWN